ncbi:MAG TPA: hypothetical protein VFX22_00680, partial [Candidatus Kapabacteria bacterium]|nr:hypothetical protein [Candidatus Kapabacteria bacterium]
MKAQTKSNHNTAFRAKRDEAQKRVRRTPRRLNELKPSITSSSPSHRLSGRELLALPQEQAARLMKRAILEASEDYKTGSDLRVFEANDPIS